MRYLWLVVRHKAAVVVAGGWTGCGWGRRLTHDWSKLRPSEWRGYRRWYEAGDRSLAAKDAFTEAWGRHLARNDHHWEWWVRDGVATEMSEGAVREMVADWFAASWGYEGAWPRPWHWPWLERHWAGLRLHPATRRAVAVVLREAFRAMGYRWVGVLPWEDDV